MGKKVEQQQAPLTLLVSHEDAENKITSRIEKGKELINREIRNWDELEAAKTDYYKWSDYNVELLKRLFSNSSISEEYSFFGIAFISEKNFSEEIKEFRDDVKNKIDTLESIKERLELIPTIQTDIDKPMSKRINSKKVFIVHGRDEAVREKVARFIEHIGHEPIILHEQVSSGRTIIEKLEFYSDVDYAIILLTPDDVGALAEAKENLQTRARQNVVLELGYFIGKLGRNKVCAIHKGNLELPSDIFGIIYIKMDEHDGWRFLLAKEMKAANFEIDLNMLVKD